MILIATLATTEVSVGAVAKADQKLVIVSDLSNGAGHIPLS